MASTIEDVQRNIFAEAERLNEEEEAKKLPAIIPTPNPTNDEGMASRNMHNKNLQSLADQNAPKDVINNYLRLAGLNQVNTSAKKTQEAVTASSIGLSLARGAIKGTFGLAALPFVATDFVAYLGRKALDVAGVPLFAGTTFEPVLSGAISRGGVEIANLLDPNISLGQRDPNAPESAIVNRAAEKIGEFVAPGGLITKGLTNVGAKLLSKAPEALNFFQKVAVQVAANPLKMQAIEAGFNTTAAIAGEITATAANPQNDPSLAENAEWMRFGAEIGSTFGLVIGGSFISKLNQHLLSRLTFTEAQQIRAAELRVGELFNEWGAAGPEVLAQMKVVGKLETEIRIASGNPDFRFTTADIMQHPDVQAALMKIVQTGKDINAATRYLRTMEANRENVNQWISGLTPLIESGDSLKGRLNTYVEREVLQFQKEADATVGKAIEEAILLHPERGPEAAGQHAIETLDMIHAGRMEEVEALYTAVDRGQKFRVNRIVHANRRAGFDPRNQSTGGPKGMPLAEQELIGREFGDIPTNMIAVGMANFKDGEQATIGRILAYRRLVSKEISVAKKGGDSETVERLMGIRNGIDSQFDAMEKVVGIGKEARMFKKANEMRRQIGEIFDNAFAKITLSKDLHSINTIAPEDIMNRFVRSESGTGSVRSAKIFREIFGNTPESRLMITDTIDYKLSQMVDGSTGRLDGGRARAFLNTHKANLKAHGVWDRYKNADAAEFAARSAEDNFRISKIALEENALGKMSRAENLDAFVRGKKASGELESTRVLIEKTGDPLMLRGWKRRVWDVVLKSGDTTGFDTVDQMIRNPGNLLKALRDNATDLQKGLGKTHYEALLRIARVVKLQDGVVGTFGTQAVREAIESHGGQQRTGRMMSKIRASMQGFVSPTFTAVQLLNEGMDFLSVNAAVKVLEEASYNIDVAIRLAKLAQKAADARSIKQLSQSIKITGLIILEDRLTEDDARTDVTAASVAISEINEFGN